MIITLYIPSKVIEWAHPGLTSVLWDIVQAKPILTYWPLIDDYTIFFPSKVIELQLFHMFVNIWMPIFFTLTNLLGMKKFCGYNLIHWWLIPFVFISHSPCSVGPGTLSCPPLLVPLTPPPALPPQLPVIPGEGALEKGCKGGAGGGPHVFICGVSTQILLCIFVYIGLSSLLLKCKSSLYILHTKSISMDFIQSLYLCIDIKYFVIISSNL